MKDLNNFLKMTILGGFFVILPLLLFFYFFIWLTESLIIFFEPLSLLYKEVTALNMFVCHLMAFATFLMFCFIIGVFVKTQLGIYMHYYFDFLLKKIPGYSIFNDILNQFFGKEKKSFRKVLLIDRFSNGIYETGFLTDEFLIDTVEYYAVFIPTGPNPTSGFIVNIKKSLIIKESTKIDKAMKSIIACGAGSSNIWGDTDV